MGTHPIFESDFDCLTELFSMSFSRRLQEVIADVEYRANNEPDFDIELRDEFFDFDTSNESSVEKANKKLEQYMEKKRSNEERKGRLKLSKEWNKENINEQDLEATVDRNILERQHNQWNETINSTCNVNQTVLIEHGTD